MLIYGGLLLVALGLVLSVAPGALSWFGKLPGDINIQRGGTRVFIPITSMVLVSLILTILFNVLKR